MRICWVLHSLDISGNEKEVCLLAQGLKASEHDIRLVVLDESTALRQQLEEAGVPMIGSDGSDVWEQKFQAMNFSRTSTIGRAFELLFIYAYKLPFVFYPKVRAFKPDVLITHLPITAFHGVYAYSSVQEFFQINRKPFLKFVFLSLPQIILSRTKLESKLPSKLKLKDIGTTPDFDYTKDKIIVISSSLADGGAERQTVNTLLGFYQIGVKAELWCNHLHNDYYKFYLPYLEGKVRVSAISFRKLQLLYEIFINNSQILVELSDLRKNERFQYVKKVCPTHLFQDIYGFVALYVEAKPEIVYVWQDYTNITAGLAAWIVGVPKVIMITRSINPSNFSLYNRHMKPIYQFLATQENCTLLNNSHAGARDYEKWLGLEEGSIQVLHNGLYEPERLSDEEINRWREAYQVPYGKKVVGTIMRLSEEKSPFLWIEAASKVKKSYPDCVFLIIGEGPLRSQMEQKIATLGLQESFYMPGRLQDVRFPLACMDIFLLTSRNEGLPNVLIEAQMMEVPVITTPADGAIETIVPGMSGHCSKTHDAEELASYVLQELESGTLQANQEQIKTLAQQRFSVQRMVAETLTFFGK